MDKYVLDDGSLESKVLQHEMSDAKVIKVGKYNNLNEWLVDIIEENDEIKFVYLHFCQGDLIKRDVDIRSDVSAALHNYPYLRIILPFEQMDRPSIERKAKNYGISVESKKPDPFILPGFTTEYPVKDPDDEMKDLIEENKEKFHFVEYAKYSVGGEAKEVPALTPPEHIGQDLIQYAKEAAENKLDSRDNYIDKSQNQNLFTNKIKEFKDKRRRKKSEK